MDIISVPIVIENKKIDSPHRLIILAAQRAKQIFQATHSSTETIYAKVTTIALEEILEGRVTFLLGKGARTAQNEAKRARADELRTWGNMAKQADLLTEIKKELSVYVDSHVIDE